MGFANPKTLDAAQKRRLNKNISRTPFEKKWSEWIVDISPKTDMQIKDQKAFQDLMKLKGWRNNLTHYKIHDLMLVAHEIETVENAKEAYAIARNAIEWYFQTTGKVVPEWITRDILKNV